jgi:hypothetical protein
LFKWPILPFFFGAVEDDFGESAIVVGVEQVDLFSKDVSTYARVVYSICKDSHLAVEFNSSKRT